MRRGERHHTVRQRARSAATADPLEGVVSIILRGRKMMVTEEYRESEYSLTSDPGLLARREESGFAVRNLVFTHVAVNSNGNNCYRPRVTSDRDHMDPKPSTISSSKP